MNNILDQHQGEISKELSRDFFKSVKSKLKGKKRVVGGFILGGLTATNPQLAPIFQAIWELFA